MHAQGNHLERQWDAIIQSRNGKGAGHFSIHLSCSQLTVLSQATASRSRIWRKSHNPCQTQRISSAPGIQGKTGWKKTAYGERKPCGDWVATSIFCRKKQKMPYIPDSFSFLFTKTIFLDLSSFGKKQENTLLDIRGTSDCKGTMECAMVSRKPPTLDLSRSLTLSG